MLLSAGVPTSFVQQCCSPDLNSFTWSRLLTVQVGLNVPILHGKSLAMTLTAFLMLEDTWLCCHTQVLAASQGHVCFSLIKKECWVFFFSITHNSLSPWFNWKERKFTWFYANRRCLGDGRKAGKCTVTHLPSHLPASKSLCFGFSKTEIVPVCYKHWSRCSPRDISPRQAVGRELAT